MAELPDIRAAASTAVEAVTSRLSVLDSAMSCKHCGSACTPSRKYDPKSAAFHAETNGEVPTWHCENCDTHFRRNETSVTAPVVDRE